jgi:ribokinase
MAERIVRCAVVGHVEWIDFVPVEHVPEPGDIVTTVESWGEPGGGGAVAALELRRLGADTTFFVAVGDDDLGRRTAERLDTWGLRLELAMRAAPQRRGFTYVDADGERTITVLGEKLHAHADDPLAWNELESTDAVYFTGGDVGALREARRARTLVATARELTTLAEGGVELDVLVRSARDPDERYDPGDLEPPPKLVVTTGGAAGGQYAALGGEEGRWDAVHPPGPIADMYGSGDCFAAALTFALGEDRDLPAALAFAAERGALAMTRRGVDGTV